MDLIFKGMHRCWEINGYPFHNDDFDSSLQKIFFLLFFKKTFKKKFNECDVFSLNIEILVCCLKQENVSMLINSGLSLTDAILKDVI